MDYKFVLVLCLYITSIHSVPIKVQLLPLQYGMQPQNLLPLQNPFFKQALPNMQSPYSPFMYSQQPILILLPPTAPAAEADRYSNLNEDISHNFKSNTGLIDHRKDAVILDAGPNSVEEDFKKSTDVIANGARFFIGQIISSIPFLPIEINVPDTISWIAGQFPNNWFSRPEQKPENMKRLSNKGPMPILVVPAPMI